MFTKLTVAVPLALTVVFCANVQADEIDAGRGPVQLYVPASYDPTVPAPLIVLLHGFTLDGESINDYVQPQSLAEEFGFLYAYPDGSRDANNRRAWNATDGCCGDNSSVDDVGYLLELINRIKGKYNIDPTRVSLFGHSNGGFMSYRMACDQAETISAIASLAGATWADPALCQPAASVHILQIHGTADQTIRFDGGNTAFGPQPGAVASVTQWAAYNGCSPASEGAVPGCGGRGPPCDDSIPQLDLEATIAGDETRVMRFAAECMPHGSTELWWIPGGVHIPNLSSSFSRHFVTFLLDHPKTDCNGNGIADQTDIADGSSLDRDGNGFPDECELGFFGDFDLDGDIDLADYITIMSCVGGPGVRSPCCVGGRGQCSPPSDLDHDDDVDLADVLAFQAGFTGAR